MTIKKESKKTLAGLHVVGRIISRTPVKLRQMAAARKFVSSSIKAAGLHELGSCYHKFPGGGFTGVVCLVESHVAFHTWPELGWLTLDVYLCNYSRDNSGVCRALFDRLAGYYSPVKILRKEIER